MCLEKIECIKEAIEELRDDLKIAKRELEFTNQVNRSLNPVIQALIAEPIASDKAELDITKALLDLKQREALVSIGSNVYQMETIELNKITEYMKQRARAREQQIREQTHAKYCKSRSQVEREIYSLSETEVNPAVDTGEIESEEEEIKRLQQKYRELLNKEQKEKGKTQEEKTGDTDRKNTDEQEEWKDWYED